MIRPNPVPTPKPTSKVIPWDIPGIQCYEPPDGIFYAQMGPTGGKQGYSAITGTHPLGHEVFCYLSFYLYICYMLSFIDICETVRFFNITQ